MNIFIGIKVNNLFQIKETFQVFLKTKNVFWLKDLSKLQSFEIIFNVLQ